MSVGITIPDSSVELKYHVDQMEKVFIFKASLNKKQQKQLR